MSVGGTKKDGDHPGSTLPALDLKELSRQGMQKIREAQEKRAKIRMERMGQLRSGILGGGKRADVSGKAGIGERLLSKAGRSKNNRQSAALIYHSQKPAK